MEMVTHRELVRALEAFGAGEMGLEDFNRWIAPISWEMPADIQDVRADAVFDAEIFLSEFVRGDRTEAELRQAVADVARELREHAAA